MRRSQWLAVEPILVEATGKTNGTALGGFSAQCCSSLRPVDVLLHLCYPLSPAGFSAVALVQSATRAAIDQPSR